MTSALRHLSLTVLAIGIVLGVNYASAAWTNPTAVPPGANIAVPINIGTVAQAKAGTISTVDFYSGWDGSAPYNFSVNTAGTVTAVSFSGPLSSYTNLPAGTIAGYAIKTLPVTCTGIVAPATSCSACVANWTNIKIGADNAGGTEYYACRKN